MSSNATKRLEAYLGAQAELEGTEGMLLSEVAYLRLLDALRHAGLKPGEPLSKNRISQVMGISRTPVREAIQRLCMEGLLEDFPGRMIAIAAPSIHEVLDAIEIRAKLEPWMASQVAGKLSLEATEELRATIEQMEHSAEMDDRGAWAKADTVYHELLSNNCPNALLGEIVLHARNRVLRTVSDESHTSQKYLLDGTERHAQVAEAIIAGDAQLARELMEQHLQRVQENMLKGLERKSR